MKEPKRLFESGNPVERAVLGVGREELPPIDLEQKTLTAMAQARLGAGAATAMTTSSWTLSRSILVGVTAAIGVGALLLAIRGWTETTTAPSPATSPAAAISPGSAPATPRTPAMTAPPTTAPSPPVTLSPPIARLHPASEESEANERVVTPDSLPPVAGTPPARRAATPSSDSPAPVTSASIAREVELLDSVKTKLGAGQAAEASRALDTYDGEFPAGTLRPEATVLRVRALLLRGDRARAEKVAKAFLTKHPAGVHAKRVRALFGDPDGFRDDSKK